MSERKGSKRGGAVQPDGLQRTMVLADGAAARWCLSERQRDVLARVLCGDTNRDIAHALGCAENTVEYHMTVILKRSSARGRTELVCKVWAAS
jgi:DNA-binding NarL/FixJ family response regulator